MEMGPAFNWLKLSTVADPHYGGNGHSDSIKVAGFLD
jgi:hypothetical protein